MLVWRCGDSRRGQGRLWEAGVSEPGSSVRMGRTDAVLESLPGMQHPGVLEALRL